VKPIDFFIFETFIAKSKSNNLIRITQAHCKNLEGKQVLLGSITATALSLTASTFIEH